MNAKRLFVVVLALVAGAGLLAISLGQANPEPEPIPLFGISPESLAHDEIYVYPAGRGADIPGEQAEVGRQGTATGVTTSTSAFTPAT
jgi:hypothetical protein